MFGLVLNAKFDRNSLHRERFEHVALLNVSEISDHDAALKTRLHLTHVILEPAERFNTARMDHDIVSQHANLAVPGERTLGDVTTRNRANFRDVEHLANVATA